MGVDGVLHEVIAVGLERLTREADGGDLEVAYSKFPDIPRHQITRPKGDVDVLLGQDFSGHLPHVEHVVLLDFLQSGGIWRR